MNPNPLSLTTRLIVPCGTSSSSRDQDVCNRCACWAILFRRMTDQPLKSAVELAMERLRKKDEAAGIAPQPLSDAQKAAIAEARNFCEAKLAEQEVLHHS